MFQSLTMSIHDPIPFKHFASTYDLTAMDITKCLSMFNPLYCLTPYYDTSFTTTCILWDKDKVVSNSQLIILFFYGLELTVYIA